MKKIFVLDTNVLLHDPNAIFAFEEHEVIIPAVVLEEIDSKKEMPMKLGVMPAMYPDCWMDYVNWVTCTVGCLWLMEVI